MFSLRAPSDAVIREFTASQRSLSFTYPDVGASARTPPVGFNVDRTRVRLGAGRQTYSAGIRALREWKQFDLGWVNAGPADTSIDTGQVIAVWARVFGVSIINACRIVYVVDEDGPITRFGFAYGTLPGHVESGEERFLVEWDRSSDEVHYDILAFSRPRHWTARLGSSFARRQQKRFARDSAAAMQAAVAKGDGPR
jgi:uncharacterized protein (UPF0548 family)